MFAAAHLARAVLLVADLHPCQRKCIVDGKYPIFSWGLIRALSLIWAQALTSSSEIAPLPFRSVASPIKHWVKVCVANPPNSLLSQLNSLLLAAAICTKFSS